MSRPTTPARHAARTPGTVRRRLATAALAAAATAGVTVGTAGTVTADAEPAAPAPAAAPAPEAAPAGPAMHAGSTIIMGTTRGPVGECTLSDIAGADGQLYGVTAGHCVDPAVLGEPLPVDQVRVGETVCKDGSRTGRTCGPVLGVNPVSQDIVALIPALAGDSGGALTVNRGGTWHPVGILSGGSPLLFNAFDSTTQALNG